MSPKRLLLAPLLLALLPACGCSLKQLAVDQTAAILRGAMPAFERDDDYELVRQALPGNIKMMEGFLEADPRNPDLLLMLSQAYTAYAMVFLEDAYERAEEDSAEAEALKLQTRRMYLRGHAYGLRLLERRRPGFSAAFAAGGPALAAALAACDDAADTPGVFWAGMPLAGAINLGRDDVEMIALVGKAKALVSRALALDEAYYHAGSHMVLGSLWGSTPKMLGGDTDKAKKHFDRALALTKRGFLLVQVMQAMTLAVQLQDAKMFDALLKEVEEAPLSVDPDQQLANVAAKRKAARLKAKKGELF